MRATIVRLLNGDAELRNIGLPKDAIYQADSTDTPPEKPFIIIRWSDRESAYALRRGPSQPNLVDLWCYDERGDFSRIDAIIKRIKQIFDEVSAVQTPTGWITQIDWVGDGGDNYDDTWKAIVRTSTYRVIASYGSP